MTRKTTRPEYSWNESRECWEKNVRRADGTYTKLRAYGRGSLPELKKMIRDFEIAQEQLAYVESRTTVEKVARQWMAAATADLSFKGAEAIRGAVEHHIIPELGNIDMLELLPRDIDRLLGTMAGRSASLRSKVLSAMRRICAYAIENRLALTDPTVGKKAGGVPAAEKEALTPEQQRTIVDAVRGTRAYLFVMLCLYAGLRREEALGLAWADVHLDGAYPFIDVTHAVHFEGARGVRTDALKTTSARRRIPVPPILADALRASERPHELVVTAADGSVCSKQSFRLLWRSVESRTRKPGEPLREHRIQSNGHPWTSPTERPIDFDVTPHQLRHTYISELCAHSAETGLDLKTIQQLAGHSDPTITMRIYAHVMAGREADTAAKIAGVFADRA